MNSPVIEKTAGNRRHAEPSAPTIDVLARATGAVIVMTVALAVIAIAFALPAARSKPHEVPIGATGPLASQIANMLERNAPGAFRVTTYSDATALRAAIRNRQEYGGIAFGAGGPVVLTATGASPAVAQAITQMGNELGHRAGVSVRAEDLAPPTVNDPRGAGMAASTLPVTLAGLLPAVALVLLFPQRRWTRVVALVVFSLVAAVTLAIVMRDVLGTIDQNLWGVTGGLLLGMLGAGLAVLGLGSLFGRAGLAIGSSIALLLGNPLSGLTSAPEMLPSGWGTLGQYLPQGATATLLRANAFFDGAGAGRAITVLTCWALGGVALVGVAALRAGARRSGSEPATTGGAPSPS